MTDGGAIFNDAEGEIAVECRSTVDLKERITAELCQMMKERTATIGCSHSILLYAFTNPTI